MLDFLTGFLASDIRTATPLLIAALGVVFSERAGIVNIGIEGFMLTGALMGVVGSWATGSVVAGTLIAMVSVMLFALVFAYFTITVGANQTVVGVAVNILAGGLTITLNRTVFGVNTSMPRIDVFDAVKIPYLSELPIVGKALFSQSIPVYIALVLVPILWFVLMKTNVGLNVRAVGDHPQACDTVGIDVVRTRYGAGLFSGLMAGFAGAFVSMGQLSFFTEGMVAGRGFIVLAAVVFGNYTPVGVLGAALLFGAGDALQYNLQAANTNILYQFLTMMPYIITLGALCGFIRRSNKPLSSGVHYRKG